MSDFRRQERDHLIGCGFRPNLTQRLHCFLAEGNFTAKVKGAKRLQPDECEHSPKSERSPCPSVLLYPRVNRTQGEHTKNPECWLDEDDCNASQRVIREKGAGHE